MIASLVITLREGIEAALVIGIILAYLSKTGRLSLARFVYTGVALAVAASIAVAGIFWAIQFDAENEYLEGALLGAAGVLVATMVVWMWRTARSIRREMEDKLAGIIADTRTSAGGVGLLLFTFVMVFREGIETALFLFAATLGEFDLLSLTGALLGLALAVFFAVLLIKGSVRINLARFFSVTSFILLLLALRLLLGSAHEFAEVGVLPMSKEVMSFIGLFVRDNSTAMIMIALLAAPVLMILWDAAGGRRPAETGTPALTAAERRKHLAAARQDRLWRGSLASGAVVIMLAMGSATFASGKPVDPTPVQVSATGDAVRIPVTNLPEGQLQKFVYSAGDVDVRFIAMLHEDGSVHAGFDACQICGTVGYMQDGDYAVCKNCNAPILTETIGEGGGCNPLPIGASVKANELVVPLASFEEAKPVLAKK